MIQGEWLVWWTRESFRITLDTYLPTLLRHMDLGILRAVGTDMAVVVMLLATWTMQTPLFANGRGGTHLNSGLAPGICRGWWA